MIIDSSEGGLGHTSYLWFHFETDSLKYYQFWYYSYGENSAKLSTTCDAGDRTFDIELHNKGRWYKSDCFALPELFDGNIYIIAEHGGGYDDDIAVDNVALMSLCKGKFMVYVHH